MVIRPRPKTIQALAQTLRALALANFSHAPYPALKPQLERDPKRRKKPVQMVQLGLSSREENSGISEDRDSRYSKPC